MISKDHLAKTTKPASGDSGAPTGTRKQALIKTTYTLLAMYLKLVSMLTDIQ